MALVEVTSSAASVVAVAWWFRRPKQTVWDVHGWTEARGRLHSVAVRSAAAIGRVAAGSVLDVIRGDAPPVDRVTFEAVFVGRSARAALTQAQFVGAVTAGFAWKFGEPSEVTASEWRGSVLPEFENGAGREAAKRVACELLPGRVRNAPDVVALAARHGEHVIEAIGVALAGVGYTAPGGKAWRPGKSKKSSKRGARISGGRKRARSGRVASS